MEWRSKILPFLFSPFGRLRRQWFIVTWISCIVAIPLLIWLKSKLIDPSFGFNILIFLACFLPLVPKTVAAVRRCHDCGFSGWFAMPCASVILFLSATLTGLFANAGVFASIDQWGSAFGWAFLIMFIADIVLSIIPGTQGPNRYGPATKEPLTPTEPDVF